MKLKTFNQYFLSENQDSVSSDILDAEELQYIGTFDEFLRGDDKDRIIKKDSIELNDDISKDFNQDEIEKSVMLEKMSKRERKQHLDEFIALGDLKNPEEYYHDLWIVNHNAINEIERIIENDQSYCSNKIRKVTKDLSDECIQLEKNHRG